jgi:hypothetical protein
MRPRIRGLGCLGCLPFGGLIFMLLPLILIGALVYFLVNRQKPTVPGGFCPRCGNAVSAGVRFCPSCGSPLGV